jgi:penicillin-binding protein 2
VAQVFAQAYGTSEKMELERIHQRYAEISARIVAIREDVWTRKYTKDMAAQAPSSGDDDADLEDKALDERFRMIQLADEVSAHMLRTELAPGLALYFRQHASELPGLVVRDMAQYNRREYPFAEATAHLVGTLRSVDGPTLKAHPFKKPNLLTPAAQPFEDGPLSGLGGYLPGDSMGETGVEQLAEAELHGIRGERLLDLSLAGSGTAPVDASRLEPIPGRDVRLTIDASLQKKLYDALKDPAKGLLKGQDGQEHFVALVVLSMDGQLMAAVSYPSYDPNQWEENRMAWMQDTYRRPLFNRALSGTYNPGSTVKPLEAAAALTEHVITPSEQITCMGHLYANKPDQYKCTGDHGPISLVDAIAKSCNVYFYTIGGRLGLERLVKWYGNYGFGQDIGLELGEAKGDLPRTDLPDPEMKKRHAILMGIGQGPVDVTVLQLANAYATLLRGGVAVAPRILASTPPSQTQAVRISPQDLAVVRQGMEQCTTRGTGKEFFGNMHLRVAGKTGTAEKEREVFDADGNPVEDPSRPLLRNGVPQFRSDGTAIYRPLREQHDDAWFVGYAPADKPQFVVAAVMEWGGHGGKAAAPMVKEAFLQLERHSYLPQVDVP